MNKLRTHLLASAAVVALSGAAYAADMGLPIKAAPVPAPIPYAGWQGWYIGGAIGANRVNTTATTTFNSNSTSNTACQGGDEDAMASCATAATGFTGGVQVGYDWQSRYFVYGVVADWTWSTAKHTVTLTGATSAPFQTAKIDWFATFRGRMGLAVDDTMVYMTGGLALGHLKSSTGCTSPCYSGANFTNALNKTKVGWVAGVGAEHKFNQNWSVFGEFLYYDFGHASATGQTVANGNVYSTEFTHEMFQGKLGLNYRF
jgi:outer membrane immunogenic protein